MKMKRLFGRIIEMVRDKNDPWTKEDVKREFGAPLGLIVDPVKREAQVTELTNWLNTSETACRIIDISKLNAENSEESTKAKLCKSLSETIETLETLIKQKEDGAYSNFKTPVKKVDVKYCKKFDVPKTACMMALSTFCKDSCKHYDGSQK
jgi:hypothetical protein